MKKNILCLMMAFMLVFMTACKGTDSQTNDSNTVPDNHQSDDANKQTAEENGFKDLIKIGIDVDPGIMDPRIIPNTSTERVTEFIFDGLIELNPSYEAVPCLAESWEQVDDTTWVFNLRKNVKFHDGNDFTAKDVKHTYETELDPNFNAKYKSLYTPIREIEIIDDYTVKFVLSQPYSPFLYYLDLAIVPSNSEENESFSTNPVGTGPYIFKEWDKNSKVVLEANPDYWAGEPLTKTLEIYIIPDNTTRVAALESGDVDLVHSPLSPQDVERIKNDDRFNVFESSGLSATFLTFNHYSGITQDRAVRIGVSYMIDKETISRDIYLGMDKAATSTLFPALEWVYSDDVKGYEFDPEKGKQVLAEAGWKDSDNDGFLDKDGQKLSIELKTHTEDPNRIQAMEYIQNVLTNNGIDAKVVTYEWPTFYADIQSGNYEVGMMGVSNVVDPDRYLYKTFRTDGGSSYGVFSNAELDKLLDDTRAISDRDKRAELYHEAAQIINDEVMHNVLLYQGYVSMYNKSIEGYIPNSKPSLRSLKDAKIKQ